MTKWLVVCVVCLLGLASVAVAQPDPSPAPVPAPTGDRTTDRKACTDAMNADPEFAKSVVLTFNKNLDAEVEAAHLDAQDHIRRNERSVIYAYAALWVIAAGFVVFLWRRQVALRGELAQLRRDLEAEAKDGAK